jgi:amidase
VDPFDTLSVQGPMARNVGDLALMLDAMVGGDPADPLAFPAPAGSFTAHVDQARAPKRVAFTPDLGGFMVAAEVKDVSARAARRFEAFGVAVEEASPDLADAREIFQVLRALKFATAHGEKLALHRDKLKPEVIWNIERGLKLSAEEIARALRARAALFYRTADFFRRYDLLLCPAAPVPPFPVEERYVSEVDGHKYETYIDWVAVTFAITLTGSPALVLPCGFTADGRPIGLQLVAPARGEAALLQAAKLFEDAAGLAALVPLDPRPPRL